MRIVDPSVEFIASYTCPETVIERMGRIAYQSQDKITADSSKCFIRRLRKSKHLSVLEHSSMTLLFVCDRGVTHELVRHRLCAFTQESTRYCNYGDEIVVICPPGLGLPAGQYSNGCFPQCAGQDQKAWLEAMWEAETVYTAMLKLGHKPQIARGVLPTCLKTQIGVTANFREWLHIFELRTAPDAHPQIRSLMNDALAIAVGVAPTVFGLEDTPTGDMSAGDMSNG